MILTSRYRRAIPLLDRALDGIIEFSGNPLLSLIVTLVLGVLAITARIRIFVAVSLGASWLIATLWISRSARAKQLTSAQRLLVILLSAFFLAAATLTFGNWVLNQYQQQPQARVASVEIENPPNELKLIFKDSPIFTPARKQQISNEMEAFYRYLVGLGFDAPKEVPPIGISLGKGTVSTFVFPGPVYWQSIGIGEHSVDDPIAIRKVYANYAFRTMLRAYSHSLPDKTHRVFAGLVFSDYFVYSFSIKDPPLPQDGMDDWVQALWDIRKKFGQDFTDRALFFTFKAFDDPREKDAGEEFNAYFFGMFLTGAEVVDYQFQKLTSIGEILRAHRLIPQKN